MKYTVTITEIHEVIVEAQDKKNALACIQEFPEIIDGGYLAEQLVEASVYEGDESPDFTMDNDEFIKQTRKEK